MKKKYLLIIIITLAMGIYFASSTEIIKLEKGENKINWSINQEISAKELTIQYPKIQSLTYYDSQNISHGFINVYGGIGENFIIIPGNNYEINTEEEVLIIA